MGLDTERIVGNGDEDLLCSICQDVLDDALETPCRHAFCRICITKWLEQKNTCPQCIRQVHFDLKPLPHFMRSELAKMELW